MREIAGSITRAMSGDELGIYTARHGDVVLRSAFQLVFCAAGQALRAVAAEGLLRPFREGSMLEPRGWLDSLDPEERTDMDCLGAALHLANHTHIGISRLDHLLVLRQAKSMCFAETVAPLMCNFGIDGAQMIGALRDPSRFDATELAAFGDRFRAIGGRIALGSADRPNLRTIRSIGPEIVSIDGGWFRRICENETATRLLRSFVHSMQRQGSKVLIEGIETQAHLVAALYVGADLVTGFLLSRPRLIGAPFPDEVIRLSDVLDDGAQVIPLFGSSGTTHQSG